MGSFPFWLCHFLELHELCDFQWFVCGEKIVIQITPLDIMKLPGFLVLMVALETVTFTFLNTFWFYKITKGIIKALSGEKKKIQ